MRREFLNPNSDDSYTEFREVEQRTTSIPKLTFLEFVSLHRDA